MTIGGGGEFLRRGDAFGNKAFCNPRLRRFATGQGFAAEIGDCAGGARVKSALAGVFLAVFRVNVWGLFRGEFLRRGVRFGFLAGVKFLFLDVFQPLPQKAVKVRAEPGPVALSVVQINLLILAHEIQCIML